MEGDDYETMYGRGKSAPQIEKDYRAGTGD